jgi:mRNA interferase MazF
MSVKRGDIYYADLSPVVGSEQGGLRPVLIIQNDVGNRYSPTVIAAAITSRLGKNRLPTHIDVYADRVGLVKDSVILLEQVRTLDKRRLKEKMGHLDEDMMVQVNRAIAVSVGLGDWQPGEAPAYVASSQTPSTAPTPMSPPTPTPAPMPAAAASVAPEVGVGVTMAAPDVSPSMAAELTTAVAASPEFGEVSDGNVVR